MTGARLHPASAVGYRIVGGVLFLMSSACTMAPGIRDRPLLLAAPAPPTRAADITVYEGRPSRPYDALALVRACAFFTYPEEDLREQAASIGADAIAERSGNNERGPCLSGIAVRFRR